MKQENKKEKRVVKSYKVRLSVYEKAKKKATKNKTTVTNILEDFLYDYAE